MLAVRRVVQERREGAQGARRRAVHGRPVVPPVRHAQAGRGRVPGHPARELEPRPVAVQPRRDLLPPGQDRRREAVLGAGGSGLPEAGRGAEQPRVDDPGGHEEDRRCQAVGRARQGGAEPPVVGARGRQRQHQGLHAVRPDFHGGPQEEQEPARPREALDGRGREAQGGLRAAEERARPAVPLPQQPRQRAQAVRGGGPARSRSSSRRG